MDSNFTEELYDDDSLRIESESDCYKNDLIRELLNYIRLGMTPKIEVNGNSSIEELENALEELREAPLKSWQEFEERKEEEMEEKLKHVKKPRYPEINEEDIMNAIMEGYGDMLGY